VIVGVWVVDGDDDFSLLIRSQCPSGSSILEVLNSTGIIPGMEMDVKRNPGNKWGISHKGRTFLG